MSAVAGWCSLDIMPHAGADVLRHISQGDRRLRSTVRGKLGPGRQIAVDHPGSSVLTLRAGGDRQLSMKTLLLMAIGLVVCLVLFVTGIFLPARSHRMQREVDGLTRKGEQKSKRRAGRFGDLTGSALARMRRAANKSARKGRELRDNVPLVRRKGPK